VQVRTVHLPTGAQPTSDRLAPLLSTLPLELRGDMEAFVAATFAVRPPAAAARVYLCSSGV
jgi:ATP citrate (pro-S)-lyase